MSTLEPEPVVTKSPKIIVPKHEVYVLLDPWRKRPVPNGGDSQGSPKRQQKLRPRPPGKRDGLTARQEEERLKEDYAPALAEALSKVHTARPRFLERPAPQLQAKPMVISGILPLCRNPLPIAHVELCTEVSDQTSGALF